MNTTELTEALNVSIAKAEALESKLTSDVLNMPGMSGTKGRHFLNNVVEKVNHARYLEIGCWAGSTLCSALYKNAPDYHAAIDSFQESNSPKAAFHNNCVKFLGAPANFIEADCFAIDPVAKGVKDINVYFFDGLHTAESHEKSITYYYPCLADEFIFIVDDWSWPEVQKGTTSGLEKMRVEVVYFQEPGTPAIITDPAPPESSGGWWNGMLLSVCKKM